MPKKNEDKEETEEEEELIPNYDSEIINDDHKRITKQMSTFINLKNLTVKNLKAISDLNYVEQIIIFRQRSLKEVGHDLKKLFPKQFHQKEIQNIHQTRYRKQVIDAIEEEKKAESSKPRRSKRLERIEILGGYIINNALLD